MVRPIKIDERRTDEGPSDTPINMQKATVVMVCDAQNYTLKTLSKTQ